MTARLALAGGLAYGALVGVQEGYDYATTSPRFEVRALTYAPTPHVDDARLRELMALAPGTNILALDLDEIAGRIAAEPWVARATVTRVLPDGLDVEVEEHEPSAVLLAGGFYLLSAEGLPFKALEPGERDELPIVSGFRREQLLAEPERVQHRIARGLQALQAYRAKRRPQLSEVHVDDSGAVTLYTAELGTQLRLGRGDVEQGLARFDALRAALGEESDKLAVAHLDASPAPERKERVVASFFPAREAPTLIAQAEAHAVAKAVAHDAEREAKSSRKARREGSRARKRGRIPHYE